MKKLISNTSRKAGLAPGSLVYTGDILSKSRITLFNYTPTTVEKKEVQSFKDLKAAFNRRKKTWVKIEGISDTTLLSALGEFFKLNNLSLEDVANINERPKVEHGEGQIFVTIKGIEYDSAKKEFSAQQISFLLEDTFILSFHEAADDTFEALELRLKNPKSRIRQQSMAYSAYAMLDVLIDQYFVALEKFAEHVEHMDQRIPKSRSPQLLKALYNLKKEILFFRKVTLPVIDLVKKFREELVELGDDSLDMYMQDLYDHALQVNELSKTYTDMLASMFNLYFSLVGARTNQIMQTLTVMTMIFMPLTLLAGIYGMNFKHMPELDWKWGYPFLLFLMLMVVSGIILILKRKKWL